MRRRSRSCPGSVRVRTWYSGISAGTELTAYRGSNPYLTRTWDADRRLFVDGAPTFAYPVEGWGYSEVGEVVEVADDVDGTGRRRRRARHLGPPQRGGGAGRRRARPRLDRPRTPISGTFARVGSIALNAVLAADARLGDRVAVFGQGVIGLLATRLAALGRRRRGRRRRRARPAGGGARDGRRRGRGGRRRREAPGAAVREWSGRRRRRGHRAQRQRPGPARGDPLGRRRRHGRRLRLLPGRRREPAARRGVPPQPGPHRGQPDLRHAGRARRRGGTSRGWSAPSWSQVRRGRVDAGSLVTDVVDAADVAAIFERLDRGDPEILQAVLRFPAAPEDRRDRPLDTGAALPRRPRRASRSSGAGTIAQSAHLPAYEQHGVGVTGVWSRSPATTATVRERFPFVGRVYASAEELLADPEVRYVDLATGPEGRLEWIEAAVDAGKHVLAQKPLTLSADDLARLPAVLARADAAGVRVAVNHNGRWAPPWRAATLLLRARRGRRRRRRHPPARQAAAAAGRHAVRRRARTCCSPTTSCTGSTSPAPGWPTAAPDRSPRSRPSTPGSPASPTRRATRGRPRCRWPPPPAPPRPCGSPAALSPPSPGCPFWVHGTDGHAARQRAARLRPARARRRARPDRRAAERRVVRRRLRRRDGRADVRRGRGPRARELRRRRRGSVAAGPGRPATPPSGAARRSTRSRCRRERRPADVVDEVPVDPARAGSTPRAGRAGAPPPGTRVGATRPAPRRGVAAPDALPARARPSPRTACRARACSSSTPATARRPAATAATDPVDVPTVTATLVRPGASSCGRPAPSRRRRDAGRARARWRRTATRSPSPADGGSRPPPTVWCSWYRYFEEVTAADVLENLAAFDEHDLARRRGPGRRRLEPGPRRGPGGRRAVRVAGRAWSTRSGPPGGGPASGSRRSSSARDTTLAPRAPRLAGRRPAATGASDLVGLDLTHPGVLDLLADDVRAPGRPAASTTSSSTSSTAAPFPAAGTRTSTGVSAYRAGLALVREVVGPDVYLVGCGAPLLPERRAGRRHARLARHLPRGRRGRLDRAARADAAGRAGLAAGPASGSTTPTAWWPGRRTPSASGGPTRPRAFGGLRVVLRPRRRARRLGPRHGPRAARRRRDAPPPFPAETSARAPQVARAGGGA